MDLTVIRDFAPTTAYALREFDSYKAALKSFEVAAKRVCHLRGDCIEPDLDITDQRTANALVQFLLWTRRFSDEQWAQGVEVSKPELIEVAGQADRPLDQARRACLVRIKTGYRKGGESDTYSLSRPHLKGIALVLAANAAYQAAMSMRSMEKQAEDIDIEGRLNAALRCDPLYTNPLLEAA